MEALIAFLAGVALGAGGAYAYFDGWRAWMKDEAAKWEEWQMQEVKDLRAQVARIIGKEATPVAQSAAGHSACQPARADCL